MGQDKIVIHVIQGELLQHAVFAFAQGRDPSPERRHMLTEGEVEPLHKARVDLPAARREHLLDGLCTCWTASVALAALRVPAASKNPLDYPSGFL